MDQRRVLLAVVLSLAVMLLYNEFVVRPRQRPSVPGPAEPAGAPSVTATTLPRVESPDQPKGAETDLGYLSFDLGDASPIVVETDVWRATLAPQGGRLESLILKQFRRSVEPESPPLELVEPSRLLPLTVTLGPALSDAAIAYQPNTKALTLSGDETGEIILTGTTPDGIRLEKRIRFLGNSYVMEIDVRAWGPGIPKNMSIVLPQPEREGLSPSGGNATNAAVILSNGKINETVLDPKATETKHAVDARWAAFSVPFFAGALISTQPTGGDASVELIGSKAFVRMDQTLADGGTSFRVFMGPKSKEVLAEAGFDLSRLLDFGWFWFIAIPMLYALRWLHRLTGNYGVDIILLTGLVRAATIPLTNKSFRSMKDMQKIQPQLKRLQEQYKDDQAKLQKEMMELYKRHGVNPFSGCAPMVLQIPIFVGLYNALLHAIELRHAPFALWITDLSAPERLMIGGIGIPVMTLLMGGTMLVQQWLTPQQGVDPMQRQMMMIMPLFFTFMFFNFPSGLVLYWLVSNLLGITQQYLMLRATK